MKDSIQAFADWESSVFGYGYGSGEEHIIPVLHRFLCSIPADGSYDYRKFGMTDFEVWVMINILAKADIIEYGSSPRFGWLTKGGKNLRDFVASQTPSRLIEICTTVDSLCARDYCNCPGQEDSSKMCPNNPFFMR